jgi:hypothetical protein
MRLPAPCQMSSRTARRAYTRFFELHRQFPESPRGTVERRPDSGVTLPFRVRFGLDGRDRGSLSRVVEFYVVEMEGAHGRTLQLRIAGVHPVFEHPTTCIWWRFMASRNRETFNSLPPLLACELARLPPGVVVTLGLVEHVNKESAAIFPVTYTHREFMLSGGAGSEAVAFGSASLDDYGPVCEVRILFSRSSHTARMVGLRLEGEVRLLGVNRALRCVRLES